MKKSKHEFPFLLHMLVLFFLLSPSFRISVLVGAPKANTTQPGIVEAGAVYYCPWPGASDSCRQIPFDSTSEFRGLVLYLCGHFNRRQS